MTRWIFRITVLMVLVVFAGLFSIYFLASGMASPEPAPESKSHLTLDRHEIEQRREKEIDQKIETRKLALENQLIQLERQQQSLEEKRQIIEMSIEKELEKIRGNYQALIDKKQEQLYEEYNLFQKQKEQEYEERVLAKKEIIQNRLEGLIAHYQKGKVKELAAFKDGLIKKYYSQTLNLKLKLKVIELTGAERERYQKHLDDLESTQAAELEEKRLELEEETRKRIDELQTQYNQEYEDYQKQLEEEIKKDLEKKREQNNIRLETYLKTQQELLNQELSKRRKELRARYQEEIQRLERLIGEIEKEYFSLQSDLDLLGRE